MVVATQNPIEQQGTYPLPEAQLDRFLFKVVVGYPSRDEERDIGTQRIGQPIQVWERRRMLVLQPLNQQPPLRGDLGSSRSGSGESARRIMRIPLTPSIRL